MSYWTGFVFHPINTYRNDRYQNWARTEYHSYSLDSPGINVAGNPPEAPAREKAITALAERFPEYSELERVSAEYESARRGEYDPEPPLAWEGWHEGHSKDWTFTQWAQDRADEHGWELRDAEQVNDLYPRDEREERAEDRWEVDNDYDRYREFQQDRTGLALERDQRQAEEDCRAERAYQEAWRQEVAMVWEDRQREREPGW